MSTPDPAAALRALQEGFGQVPITPPTAIHNATKPAQRTIADQFMAEVGELSRPLAAPRPLGSSFAEGVVGGLTHPIQAITGEYEGFGDTRETTTANTVAEVLGGLTGGIVSFIPYFKASSFALRGVQGLGLGTNLSERAMMAIAGTVASGAFEIGAGEDMSPEAVSRRVGMGLALGAAGEAAFLGLTRARRLRRGLRTDANGASVFIDPDALALETMLHPNGASGTAEIIDRLRLVEDPNVQLEQAAAKLVERYHRFGIIPGIEDPDRLLSALRKANPKAGLAVFRPDPEGPASVLLHGFPEQHQQWRQLLGERLYEKVFMGEGPATMTSQEMDELVRAVMEGEVAPPVQKTFLGNPGALVQGMEDTGGFYRPSDQLIVVKNTTSEHYQLATWVHEYTHHLGYWLARGAGTAPPELDNMVVSSLLKVADGDLAQFEKEMFEATRQIVKLNFPGISEADLIAELDIDFVGLPKYYHSQTEQFSRLAELMFRNPTLARHHAPLATKYMTKAIDEVSPKLRMMLERKEMRFVNDYMNQRWVTNKGANQLKVWRPTSPRLSRQQIRQFETSGFFNGMEVEHAGAKKEFVGFATGGVDGESPRVRHVRRGTESVAILRDFGSSTTGRVALADVKRPLVAEYVARDAEVLARVREALNQPVKWVGVVGKFPAGFTDWNPKTGQPLPGLRRGIVSLEKFVTARSLEDYLHRTGAVRSYREWLKANGQSEFRWVGKWDQGVVDTPNGLDELVHEFEYNATQQYSNSWTVTLRRRTDGYLGSKEKNIDLGNYKTREEAVEFIKQHSQQYPTEFRLDEFGDKRGVGSLQSAAARHMLKSQGHEGLLIKPDGELTTWPELLFTNDRGGTQGTITWGPEFYSPNMHEGTTILPLAARFELDPRWTIESLLHQQGVDPMDIPRLLKMVEDSAWEHFVKNVETDGGKVIEAVKSGVTSLPTTEALANGSGIAMTRAMDGDIVFEAGGQMVGRFANADEARLFATTFPTQEGVELAPSLGVPGGFGGKAAPKFNEQLPIEPKSYKLTLGERLLSAFNLWGAPITAMANFAKELEQVGLGPAFTKVFEPLQKAMRQVDHELAGVKRHTLGGLTFHEQLKKLEVMTSALPRERRELIVRYVESLSREEVASGGLLARNMTPDELAFADEIVARGMQDQIPRALALRNIITNATKKRRQALTWLVNRKGTQATPEVQQALLAAEQMVRGSAVPVSRAELIAQLGLTEDEIWLVKNLNSRLAGANPHEFSIMAVGRYAGAKPLGKGFGSGREEFAALNKMTKGELEVAGEVEKTLEAAFQLSGMDARRQIGGYWPHLRKLVEVGLDPSTTRWMKQEVPESVSWSAARVRTGELDIYSMDPLWGTFKHVRSQLMKRYVDPLLPDAAEAQREIFKRDRRAGRIMSEYINEITGVPHESFKKLNEAMAQSLKLMGVKADQDLARSLVNTLSTFVYSATIPFRPGLIMRNYFSMVQMIAPRTGFRNFGRGLRIAMTEEGKTAAVRAGAVPTNPTSLNVEAAGGFDHVTTRFLRGVDERVRMIADKGFHWYQKADDLARAAAYHAQRLQIEDHVDDLMAGRVTREAFESKSGLSMFKPIDRDIFWQDWDNGKFADAIDQASRTLAEETIFRYRHANHPRGWGSVWGRLLGQFGTWPIQYKDYVLQGLTHGTGADRMKWAARHFAINGLAAVVGAEVFGVDLSSWVTFGALSYAGGPFVDVGVNLMQAMTGSDAEQGLALKGLQYTLIPSVDDPSSILIPGSYAISEALRAMNGDWNRLMGARELDESETENPLWWVSR